MTNRTRWIGRLTLLAMAGLFTSLLSACPSDEPDAIAGDPDGGADTATGGSDTTAVMGDNDDQCTSWGNWKLTYGAFTGTDVCSQKPSEDGLRVTPVRLAAGGAGPSFGEYVQWTHGCTGRVAINNSLRNCKLEMTCMLEESNTSEHWPSTKRLSLTFAGGKATGTLEIENSGFCAGKISAPVTATKMP